MRSLTPARNRGLTWNRSGVILFVNFSQALSRISASGGQPEVVTNLDPQKLETSHRRPFFLPDGNRFLFHAGQNVGIYAGSLDGKTRNLILPGQHSGAEFVSEAGGPSGWVVYVRDGSLFARHFNSRSLAFDGEPVALSDRAGVSPGTRRGMFSSTAGLVAYRDGETRMNRLAWYDRSGKRLAAVGNAQPYGVALHLSPDNAHAMFSVSSSASRIHIESVEMASATFTRRTFDENWRFARGFWSPDGKIVFLQAVKPGATQILQSRADWSSPPQLIREYKGQVTPWDWDPASKTLLLYRTNLGGMEALTQSSSGWEAHPFLEAEKSGAKGKFSADGRWVAYQGSPVVPGIFVTPYPPSGAKWQVSTDGYEPVWGRDGKELYYHRGDEIMSVDLDTSGRALKAGSPRTLFRAPLLRNTWLEGQRFDVAADGKRFLILERADDPPGMPFTVLVNWKSLLEKR